MFCKDLNSRTQEENEVTMVQSEKSKKPPPLSKKHRKTNLNVDNPDSELYQSQIDTLKAVNAQKEAENKKLKESNDLKTKRINILEAELEQARSFLIQQNKSQSSEPTKDGSEGTKVESLEIKTNNLETQFVLLLSKVDAIQTDLKKEQGKNGRSQKMSSIM